MEDQQLHVARQLQRKHRTMTKPIVHVGVVSKNPSEHALDVEDSSGSTAYLSRAAPKTALGHQYDIIVSDAIQ